MMRSLITFVSPSELTAISRFLPPFTIVIRDAGHNSGFMSVTNDADAVVEFVLTHFRPASGDPNQDTSTLNIFYYDSDGRLDQLCHDGTKFTGFKPGPKELQP